MPAPDEQSEPAIVNATGGAFVMTLGNASHAARND
jgi:hypothetical protein